MARGTRRWESLKASTQKRYISRGRSLGQTPAQVQQHYVSGGRMSTYRGHPTRPGGVSEGKWRELVNAAKAARMERGLTRGTSVSDVLSSLLQKGFTPGWILDKLREQKESRDVYLSARGRYLRRTLPKSDAGYDPGRKRYHDMQSQYSTADVELFYYH